MSNNNKNTFHAILMYIDSDCEYTLNIKFARSGIQFKFGLFQDTS